MRTRVFDGDTYVADYLIPLPQPLRAQLRLFAGGTQACADVVLGEHVDLHFRDGAALKTLMACPRCGGGRNPLALLCPLCWRKVPKPIRQRWIQAIQHLLEHHPAAKAVLAWGGGT